MTDGRCPESGQPVAPADELDVDHLSVRFGNTRVLTDLAFQVRHGTSLAIIGPNGAGKSILLHATQNGARQAGPPVRGHHDQRRVGFGRRLRYTGNGIARLHAGVHRRGVRFPRNTQ